jgi:hypothetical protein
MIQKINESPIEPFHLGQIACPKQFYGLKTGRIREILNVKLIKRPFRVENAKIRLVVNVLSPQ